MHHATVDGPLVNSHSLSNENLAHFHRRPVDFVACTPALGISTTQPSYHHKRNLKTRSPLSVHPNTPLSLSCAKSQRSSTSIFARAGAWLDLLNLISTNVRRGDKESESGSSGMQLGGVARNRQ
ncbi:hypothetical protein BDR07DRAFT_750953 [Suillus spraguei]|nr:hypothetical protein BDR07DRAFT_750953 [Suillus spraguei]